MTSKQHRNNNLKEKKATLLCLVYIDVDQNIPKCKFLDAKVCHNLNSKCTKFQRKILNLKQRVHKRNRSTRLNL